MLICPVITIFYIEIFGDYNLQMKITDWPFLNFFAHIKLMAILSDNIIRKTPWYRQLQMENEQNQLTFP